MSLEKQRVNDHIFKLLQQIPQQGLIIVISKKENLVVKKNILECNFKYQFINLFNFYKLKDQIVNEDISCVMLLSNITALDEKIFIELYKFLAKYKAMLIFGFDNIQNSQGHSIFNVLHKKILDIINKIKLIFGFDNIQNSKKHSILNILHKKSFDKINKIFQLINKVGLSEIENYDLKISDKSKINGSEDIFDHILFNYMSPIEKSLNPYCDTEFFLRTYTPIYFYSYSEIETSKPFLSIVMRTQGKRSEELREVLSCLIEQKCQDFEVMLVVHKATENNKMIVKSIIEELPIWMKTKIKYYEVSYGTRAVPLNVGFLNAKGEYIVALDDDDLVFANWVLSFKQLAEKSNGELLHVFGMKQEWERINNEDDSYDLYASGEMENFYCKKFNLIEQLDCNFCPFMSIAFPAELFQKGIIRFDHTLNVTEDWDVIMRAAFLCGVVDIPQITFIYRLWVNAESARNLYEDEEWLTSKMKILNKFFKEKILLAEKDTTYLIKEVLDKRNDVNYSPALFASVSFQYSEYNELPVLEFDKENIFPVWIDTVSGEVLDFIKKEIIVPHDDKLITIKGWLADIFMGRPANAAYVKVGDKMYIADYGLESYGPYNVFKNDNYKNVGFSVSIPVIELKELKEEYIEFYIISNNGESVYEPTKIKISLI